MIVIREPGPFSLGFPIWTPSLILLGVYLYAIVSALWRRRRDFLSLSRRGWFVLGLILILTPFAHRLLVVYWPWGRVVPTGPMNVVPIRSAISLPGVLLIAIAAYGLGPGPGLVVSLVAGVSWSRYMPLVATDVLALSMWGYLIGALLRLPYRGDVFRILRLPVVAAVSASVATAFILSLSRLAASQLADPLRIIDFMVVLWGSELPLWGLVGLGVGLLLQG
ncbi:MAG: hypothetical protein ACP5JG_13335, partial [Anaerolineae bacterium]